MVLLLCSVLVLSACLNDPATDAQAKASAFSRHQMRVLIASARSAEDYERLAAYYREQAALDERMAMEQERTRQDTLDHPRIGGKYPTVTENARRLHDYYAEQCQIDLQKAKSYEVKAQKGHVGGE